MFESTQVFQSQPTLRAYKLLLVVDPNLSKSYGQKNINYRGYSITSQQNHENTATTFKVHVHVSRKTLTNLLDELCCDGSPRVPSHVNTQHPATLPYMRATMEVRP